MTIDDGIVGNTYNLTTKDPLLTYGLMHKAFRYEKWILFADAVKEADVYTMYNNFCNANEINIKTARFHVFRDMNSVKHVIISQYIDTIEPANKFPINVKLYNMDTVKLEVFKNTMASLGYNYTIDA